MKRNIGIVDNLAMHVTNDSMNTERYVQEGFVAIRNSISAIGILFETEQIRIAQGVQAAGGVQPAPVGGSSKPRSIMEYKVVHNLKAVTGYKTTFRQWHQKFLSALGQVDYVYETGIQSTVKEIDIGKDVEIVLKEGSDLMGSDWNRLSADVYKVRIDKAEGKAYDKSRLYLQETVCERTSSCTVGSPTYQAWAWRSRPAS